uniref:Sperm associated antigen 16 n=1 Tax=Oncorhynchus tshawytscha TaxID=74940 RepID=A0AAZ3Q6I5_ONCTS
AAVGPPWLVFSLVLADEERSLAEGDDEDLEAAVRALRDASDGTGSVLQRLSSAKQPVSHIPEVVDDFLRNFLVKMGMSRTLDCFQAEWYEMEQRGLLKTELVEFVPDAYTHNQLLDNELKNVQRERDSYRQAASKASETLVKLQKERDFHRLQHKRVVQEKNRLVEDIKRLKKHYGSYEPALKQLSDKYQVALKQKMLISLERDRACGQANSLEATLCNNAQVRRYDFSSPFLSGERKWEEAQTQHLQKQNKTCTRDTIGSFNF